MVGEVNDGPMSELGKGYLCFSNNLKQKELFKQVPGVIVFNSFLVLVH